MNVWTLIVKDRTIRAAFMVCIVGFSGFIVWSAVSPLAEGIIAYGKIVTENNRKSVQHFEGGIIEDILIKEGDRVEAGEPLLILTGVAAQSGRDQIAQNFVDGLVSVARLNALLSGDKEWTPSPEIADAALDETVQADILARQQALYTQQLRAYEADISVLQTRYLGFIGGSRAIQGEIDGNGRELEIVRKELVQMRDFLEQKLTSADQVTRLERDDARLSADISRLNAEQGRLQAQAREMQTQITQARAHFSERVNAELAEERTKVAEAREQLGAADDVVKRSIIKAPQGGEILNLKFSTKGGVVASGEVILEIIPDTQNFIAIVEVNPSDRDVVYQNMSVDVRLSGLNSWRSPILTGTVAIVSADLKTSQRGDYSFYEARISLDRGIVDNHDIKITPGMPVEAFIVSGHSRTLFEYIWEPIGGVLRRGLQG